jgi:hypothetical protein
MWHVVYKGSKDGGGGVRAPWDSRGATVGLGGTLGCVYVVSGMHHILPCKAVILHPGHHLTADVEHNTADVACRIL